MQPEANLNENMSVKEKILSVVGNGDILFVVPPFVIPGTPVLGPHILQTIAQRKGYRADILHLNLLLASITGFERYESVSLAQPFRLLGERLFARSAHGLPPLGKSPELCLKPAASVFGDSPEYPVDEFEYKYFHVSDFDTDIFLHLEGICKSFIDEVIQTTASLGYKIIGCSSNWEQNNCSVALLNGIKKIDPGIITLMGGSNCEGQMAEGILSLSDSIDYVFSGESETSFSRFLDRYSKGELPHQRIITGKPRADLDTLPLPDYSSYVKQRERFLGEKNNADWQIGYETSRGCRWGKCYFCGMNGIDRKRYRRKSAGKALRDLEEINRLYPGQSIMMTDKVMPPSYQNDLLPELAKKKVHSPMAYEQRPGLSLSDLVRLKRAKVEVVKPGIESLSSGLLRLMNKGISAWQNISLLRNAASLEMYVDWNLLWGFPGDTVEHYEETLALLPLLRHFCPPAVFRHICIDRFSPYFERPQDFKIDNLRPWAVYNSVYSERAEVNKLAYRFIGDYVSASRQNPALIREIDRQVSLWKNMWEYSSLLMIPIANFYMIYDKRDPHEKSKKHTVTRNRAREIMTGRVYKKSNPSGDLEWALEQKLGVVLDSRYVPLVTAAPELLQTFETAI